MGPPLTAALFAVSTLCFLVASAGAQTRVLTAVGAAALLAALVQIVWQQGAGLDYALFLGTPALCVAGMAYVREEHTKHGRGSTPSSGRAS